MNDDGANLDRFVDRFVFSFEAWDILAYLAAHPDSSLTIREMATRIGRRPDELISSLERLGAEGALGTAEDGCWRLEEADAFRAQLDAFARAIDTKRGRLAVLTRLLGNISR